jgi:hypothetical protein
MANYVLAYKGGGMAPTEEEQKAALARWGAWFGGLGAAVVDAGNPFGDSRSVASDGSVANGGSAGLTGYTILSADDIDAAVSMAGGCPILAAGGSVEVYEVFPVM